jgi:hypothetical protein
VTERYPWNEEYAPEGWDYEKHDNPDYAYLKLREGLHK